MLKALSKRRGDDHEKIEVFENRRRVVGGNDKTVGAPPIDYKDAKREWDKARGLVKDEEPPISRSGSASGGGGSNRGVRGGQGREKIINPSAGSDF